MYSIDSGALIDAWVRKYPPDVMPTLWDKISDLASTGDLFAPEEVLLELERGNDDLFEWTKDRSGMFLVPSEEIQARVAHIVNTFPSFIPERAADGIWADPYVIAVAQEHSGIVVTSELLSPPAARNLKIPNVCRNLGVECLSTLEFIRHTGWKF
jgi:hypothetical protein